MYGFRSADGSDDVFNSHTPPTAEPAQPSTGDVADAAATAQLVVVHYIIIIGLL